MRPLLVFISALAALGCRDPIAVTFPPTAVRLTVAPPLFRGWWEVVESCSGRTGAFEAVDWYSTASGTLSSRGENAVGVWFPDGNRIVVARSWMDHGPLVRHEMLHAILQSGSHPAEFFERRCGDLLLKDFADATQPVPIRNAFRIAYEVLVAEATLYPRELSIRDRGTVVVRVHNPTNRAAFVPAFQFGEVRCGFGYFITSMTAPSWTMLECSSLDAAEDGNIYFAPNQTRLLIFDMRLTPTFGGPVHPGEILVSAVITDNLRRTERVTLRP